MTMALVGWSVAATAGAREPASVRVPAHFRQPASDARLERLPATADHALRVDDPSGRLRTGFGGTLVNLLPVEGSRFHLSAGGRLFGRVPRNRALDERGLLGSPRVGSGGGRGGRRFAPALLAGIDDEVAAGVSLGVDAGLVLGPAMDRGMRMPRGLRRLEGPHGRTNGVARLTMGYRF